MRIRELFHLPERRVCRTLGQPRYTLRDKSIVTEEESRLADRVVELANKYGRYGYRMITGMLRSE